MRSFVRAVIRDNNSNPLFVFQKQGIWNLVGGKVEEGEDVLTALHREVLEEVGVEVLKSRKLCTLQCVFNNEDWEGHYYEVDAYNGEPLNNEPDKLLIVGFVANHFVASLADSYTLLALQMETDNGTKQTT